MDPRPTPDGSFERGSPPCVTIWRPARSPSAARAVTGSRRTPHTRSAGHRRAAWWSSTTCPATTRPPRRSPVASPPGAGRRSAPTCTTATPPARTPTTQPPPRARTAAYPMSSFSATWMARRATCASTRAAVAPWPPSASAPAVASRCSLAAAASTSTPRSTATARSCSASHRRSVGFAWSPSSRGSATCPARCSGCSARRTRTRPPTRWTVSTRC